MRRTHRTVIAPFMQYHHHHRLNVRFSLLAGVGRLLPYSGQIAAITPVTPPERHFHFKVITRLSAPRGTVTAAIHREIGANFKQAGCPS